MRKERWIRTEKPVRNAILKAIENESKTFDELYSILWKQHKFGKNRILRNLNYLCVYSREIVQKKRTVYLTGTEPNRKRRRSLLTETPE